jgi:ubiquinone/menaquinone biosynthesis C-methylase UbiE
MDIGCGSGFFTLPAARITGSNGKVYGLDIQSNAIDEVQKKAASEGLSNVELTLGRAEDVIICHACADVVFFGIDLHDFEDPAKVLRNAHQMLKPDGKLVDLDWKKVETALGPPISKRFDEDTASHLIEQANFRIKSIKDSGKYHYLIIAFPKS